MYYYRTEQFLKADIDAVWTFFSSAKNLALITPPELDFNILTELDDEDVYEGMLIDYTVRPLFGIPIHWQTQISKVRKPLLFTDCQLKGPYKLWEHTHVFVKEKDGVLMSDEVKYQLPFGIIGTLFLSFIVKKKIEGIFAYRREALKKIYENNYN